MSYQDKLRSHLAVYKRLHLGIEESGIYHHRGRELLCDHVLPLSNEWENMLTAARPCARAFLAAYPHKRHRYFHHLNSSQAFTFNLFFPYFGGDTTAAGILLHALGQEGTLDGWELEGLPAPEEGTNIDVSWATGGMQTFCEVKLSETELGRARDDLRHRHKYQLVYAPRLAGHLEPEALELRAFLNAYQFNRNIWHMVRHDHGRLMFLAPKSNDRVWGELQHLLSGVLAATRKRIAVVAIEDVIDRLCEDYTVSNELQAHAHELRRKYIVTTE